MAWVPPGSFAMGGPTPHGPNTEDETPVTTVRMRRGYWVARHETTRAEFAAFVEATGFRTFGERTGKGIVVVALGRNFQPDVTWRNARGEDPRFPVVGVTWEDASAYAAWLDQRERDRVPRGYQYRLPTEAEHERACLGEVPGADPWPPPRVSGALRSVDEGKPNALGLVDLAGNAWEWSFSVYTERLPGGTVVDWAGPPAGALITKRGGRYCQERDFVTRDRPADHVGFRIVLAPRLPARPAK